MSTGNQKIGFDPKDPIIKGKTNVFGITIEGRPSAEIASAEFILHDLSAAETASPTVLLTKTTASGISLNDDTDGNAVATVTTNPADTVDILLHDVYFRLDYVSATASEHESIRGRIRLSPRV